MTNSPRSHSWLNAHFEDVWHNYFADVTRLNTVTIRWGKNNRQRLGAIIAKGGTPAAPTQSLITINALLRNPRIPQCVVTQTIAHELAHYAHGFCSPHPQKYPHPHRGGVIKRELSHRGLLEVYNEAEAWLKKHWPSHVHDLLGAPKPIHHERLSFLSHIQQRVTGVHRLGRRYRRGL